VLGATYTFTVSETPDGALYESVSSDGALEVTVDETTGD
jgi:hypothetical protein